MHMQLARTDYDLLDRQAGGLLDGERNLIANAANLAALLFAELPDVNWAGFYLLQPDGSLLLGPFCGKPACVRLAAGKGVCGAAVREGRTIFVEDVHAFADHIACDTASNSEIVVPLVHRGRTFGVLDIDSPLRGRFGEADRAGLERIAATFIAATDVP